MSSFLEGTPNWMAPEVIKGTQMTTGWLKADVWSLGCTVVEMVSGNLPYSYYDNPMTAMYHIASNEIPSFRDLPVSSALTAFVIACCASDPTCRPTAQELMQFEFVAPFTKNYLKAVRSVESDVGGSAEIKLDDPPNNNETSFSAEINVGGVRGEMVLSIDLFSSLDDSTESVVIPAKKLRARPKQLNTLCLDDPLLISSSSSSSCSPKKSHPLPDDQNENDVMTNEAMLQQKRLQDASTPLTTARKGMFHNDQGGVSKSRIPVKVTRYPPTYPNPMGRSPTNTPAAATGTRLASSAVKDKVPSLTPKRGATPSPLSSTGKCLQINLKNNINIGLHSNKTPVDSKAVTPEVTARRAPNNEYHSKTESKTELSPFTPALVEILEDLIFPLSNVITTTENSEDDGTNIVIVPNEVSPTRHSTFSSSEGDGESMNITVNGIESDVREMLDNNDNEGESSEDEVKSMTRSRGGLLFHQIDDKSVTSAFPTTPEIIEDRGTRPKQTETSPQEKFHISPIHLSSMLDEITAEHDDMHPIVTVESGHNDEVADYLEDDNEFMMKSSSNHHISESQKREKGIRSDQNRPNAPLSGEIRRLKEPGGAYDGLGPLGLFDMTSTGGATNRSPVSGDRGDRSERGERGERGERSLGHGTVPMTIHSSSAHRQESISEKLERLSHSGAASIRMNALKEFEMLASQHEKELSGERDFLLGSQSSMNSGKMLLRSRRKATGKKKLYNLNFDGISSAIKTYAHAADSQFNSNSSNINFRSQSAGMPVSTYGAGMDQGSGGQSKGFLGFGAVQSGLVKVPVDPVSGSLYPLTLGVNLSQHLLPAINCILPLQRRIIQSAPSLSRSVNLPPIQSMHGSLTPKGQKSDKGQICLYDQNDSKSYGNGESDDQAVTVHNQNIGKFENLGSNFSGIARGNLFSNHNIGGQFANINDSETFASINRKE